MKAGDEKNFVYLLVDEPSGESLVVDSGWGIDPIVAVVRSEKLELKYAVATHHHSDHAATLWQLGRTFDAKIVAHRSSPVPYDLGVDDGDTLKIGEKEVKILYTPGHTEDSICIYDGRNLFTGDTLLIGSCGRTDFVGGSPRKLYRSLHSVVLKLPPETVIYPGHDYGEVPFRTLSDEARLNPALLAKSYEEFIRLLRK
jgi:glyoxylase-like metal-dependent hydrolase (beta-lactamase superfamily II)